MSSLLDVGISSTHLFILGSVQVSTLFLFMNICAMRYLTAKTAKDQGQSSRGRYTTN